MTQLICNNKALDLSESQAVQFKHTNPLFAFDKMACERTTEFSLPSTPTNDSVFGLARIPAYSGNGMRRRFSAQMINGTIVKDGYLYVGSFDGKSYKCTFVCGDLLALKALKDAGSVRDLLLYNDGVVWSNSNIVSCQEPNLPNVGIVNFNKQSSIPNPSVSLRWLIEEAAAAIGVNIDFPNVAADDRQRLFYTGDEHTLDDTRVFIQNDPTASQDYVNLMPFLGLVQYQGVGAYRWNVTAYAGAGGTEWDYDNATLNGFDQFDQIKLPYDCVIKFPEDMPENLCVVTGDLFMQYIQGNPKAKEECVFIGSRRFNREGEYFGAPLRGQSVSIPANTPFMLADAEGVVWVAPTTPGQTAVIGYNAARVPAYNIEARITIDHSFVVGEKVPYNAILPDLSLLELLKIYAAIKGRVLSYDNGVTFDELALSDWDFKTVNNIVKSKDVARTFGDYGQHNIMRFDSDEKVYFSEQIKNDYAIYNDNIEAEKDLLVLPVSEGGVMPLFAGDDTADFLYIRSDSDSVTIGNANADYEYMQRVTLPKLDGLQNLCDISTQLKIDGRMSLLEYDAIKPQTLLNVRNSAYAWTERSWQKNVASFTLARAGVYTPPKPMPAPNEIWVWPMNLEPSATLVSGATLIGTGEINGLKILKYDNPVTAVIGGNAFSFTPNLPSIVVFPEGFGNMPTRFTGTAYIAHIYIPNSAMVYNGYNPFGVGSTGYIHHVWLAWDTPQAVTRMNGYDRVITYHVRAGLKAAYVAAGWPEAKIQEDYEFNPWGQITRGLLMGFENEEPTPAPKER